ncbi:aspartate/glutamate racemase family protein [Pyruvatibacter mobilis]|uniref:aspartate/glutamate racemase family protein n=1 Tax=Pyruvatibacter mobilis TaxID=1712261 RepID=UPI003BAEADD5
MRRALVLTLLHTSPRHVDVFERLFARLAAEEAEAAGERDMDLPEIRLSHVVREDLLQRAITSGVLPEDTFERAVRILRDATASSDAVLCTCSTLGPAADEAARRAAKPVLRVDRPMAALAAQTGRSIAVLATLQCTLEPACELIAQEVAHVADRADVAPVLVEDAWEALEAGDATRANALVADNIRLAQRAGANVIVLAQASMAEVLDQVSDVTVPVLTSPASGLAAAVARLRAIG